MIEADPDVPDAVPDVVAELPHPARLGQFDALGRARRAEDRGAGPAGVLQAQQAAMLWIHLEKETVAGGEHAGRALALRDKAQHRVGPVTVLVHHVPEHPGRAGAVVLRQRQARQRVGRDFRVVRA